MEARNIRLSDSISGLVQLLVDHERHRLIIADTHHHSVVIADLAGQVTQVIGTGEEGCADGVCEESQFRHPRGITPTRISSMWPMPGITSSIVLTAKIIK